jgi:hypothetical protein
VPNASGSPLAILAPNHLVDGLELTVALDAGVEQRRRRRRRCPRRSSAPVALWGAILQRVEGGSRRGSECKSKMDAQVL